jgi:hypothetical protein
VVDDNEEMIARIADALRPLPTVNDEAKARVLVAVAAERERHREELVRGAGRRRVSRWLIAGTGLAAAAVVGAVMLRTPARSTPTVTSAIASATAAPAAPGRLAAGGAADGADMAALPVQLVFRSPSASQVRVVGDFNEWDRERAPMVRDAETGLWSLTLSLRPGRHVYAFVVDDTLWVRDPRAPAAKDTDFGRPGSVLLVGRP